MFAGYSVSLQTSHVYRAESFRRLLYIELDVFSIAEIFAGDFAVVNEDIFASVFGLNKAKSFLAAEPLNCSVLHIGTFFFSPHKSLP